MSASPTAKMPAAEYLRLERASSFRNEFVSGDLFAMSGGRPAHAQLISRFARALEDALEEGPCTVTVSDLRLQIAKDEVYVYPDAMVVCGPFALADGQQDMITNPTVVVEVLSESTEAWDRGGKFAHYRRVESLQEYVLVSQNAMRVEWFTKETDAKWTYREAVGEDGVVRSERLGVALGLGRIYRKVDLNA